MFRLIEKFINHVHNKPPHVVRIFDGGQYRYRHQKPQQQEKEKQQGSMVKVLNVAEKNDVAKNVANILSNGSSRRREGFSQYNKIYDFRYELPSIGSCEMVMTSVSGHLNNYDFTENYRRWYSCEPGVLFSAPIVHTVNESGKKIQATLRREARSCSHLIIWTDCDREGENIGFEIINACREVNPRITLWRARFSEITNHAIKRAANNLMQPDKKISGTALLLSI